MGIRFSAGTQIVWACAPSRCSPKMAYLRQRDLLPEAQNSQTPQLVEGERRAERPVSRITPAASLPRRIGYFRPGSPFRTHRSRWLTEADRTSRVSSPGPGVGSGMSTTSRASIPPGLETRTAFICRYVGSRELLAEEPREELGFAVGLIPGPVAHARILGVLGVAAGRLQSRHDVPGANRLHDVVRSPMKDPDGHFRDRGSLGFVGPAADGDGRGEPLGPPGDQVPGPEAPHRQPRHVDALGVDGRKLLLEGGQELDGRLHRLGRLGRHRVLQIAPGRVDPLELGGTLGCRQEARKFRLVLEEEADAVLRLRLVVVAALAGSVEKEDEGILLLLVEARGFEEPVEEFLAGRAFELPGLPGVLDAGAEEKKKGGEGGERVHLPIVVKRSGASTIFRRHDMMHRWLVLPSSSRSSSPTRSSKTA